MVLLITIHFQHSLFENILASIRRIKDTVSERNDYHYVDWHWLKLFKSRILESENKRKTFDPQAWVMEIVRKHTDLRLPHRKILDFLSRQYDYEKKEFSQVNMSTLVRECRLGKNKAKEYLTNLEQKGLVEKGMMGIWYGLKLQ